METISLYQQIDILRGNLQQKNQDYLPLAKKAAEAKRDYMVAYTKKCFELKAQNYAATFITECVKGMEDIAKLRMEKDIAEAEVDACRESINCIKKEIDYVREEMSRQWSETRYE